MCDSQGKFKVGDVVSLQPRPGSRDYHALPGAKAIVMGVPKFQLPGIPHIEVFWISASARSQSHADYPQADFVASSPPTFRSLPRVANHSGEKPNYPLGADKQTPDELDALAEAIDAARLAGHAVTCTVTSNQPVTRSL